MGFDKGFVPAVVLLLVGDEPTDGRGRVAVEEGFFISLLVKVTKGVRQAKGIFDL